ncbi:hypothetical protein S1361_34765 [Streptomyces cyanogenus]|uniref:Uncharacterized protein n=1 Tax=Streptomyces cyanogenus TaxID=80860 RepID=A0ABX7U0I3_STRCY|nr:hypothetical protein S1361_34765 [Streptomyces cyanogenus]
MEAVLAVAVVVAVGLGDAPAGIAGPAAAVTALLVAQLAVVRPRLNRRSDRILAGEELPRSRSHPWYVALEILKAGTLVALGVSLLTV